ncbi:cytochrome b [Alsobacter sp. R-9]
MMNSGKIEPRGPRMYSNLQIILHWLIAVLVVSQYLSSFAIVRTHQPRLIGQKPDPMDMLLHAAHNRVGLLILALMFLRLVIRLAWARGKAKLADPRRSILAADILHLGFYAVLIAQAVTGAVASYLWWPASTVHVLLFKFLLLMLVGHVFAAAWHHVVLRDATLLTMVPRLNKASRK